MWETKDISEIERKLKTNIYSGLKDEEIEARIKQYGKNELKDKKTESIFIKFIKQFKDFMIIILIIAAIVSAIISKIDGSNDYFDSIIIITIVVLNAIMGVVQEAKAEKALEALKSMTAPIAKVKRNNKIKEVPIDQVVPGDIIFLEAGNYVPADCRLIKTSNLKIEESSLTGENIPVLKDEKAILNGNKAIGDMINMAFASTIVVNGHGEAIACETGMNTKVGKIAGMIADDVAPETPIQKKLAGVGKALGIGCLTICFTIFIIGVFKKIEPVEMFMTSVGLAVAAIPEGLPAIVTIVLSIGVTKMARKNSIIRKLPAVETLGSTNVICSDKTGTLTQNKMQVTEEFCFGNNKEKLLSYACMCTDCNIEVEDGKRLAKGEPTEAAIVNRAIENNIDKYKLYEVYKRILDIPFDSNRKMMSTIHKNGNEYLVITKGAPDVLLSRCKYFDENGREVVLDNISRRKIEQKNNDMAEKALRVISVAYKKIGNVPNKLESKDIENDLVFIRINRNDRSTKRRSKECNSCM